MPRVCPLPEDQVSRVGALLATPCRVASLGAAPATDGSPPPTADEAEAVRRRAAISSGVDPTLPGGSRGGACHSDTVPGCTPADKAFFIGGLDVA